MPLSRRSATMPHSVRCGHPELPLVARAVVPMSDRLAATVP
jgi:hypothetical protein